MRNATSGEARKEAALASFCFPLLCALIISQRASGRGEARQWESERGESGMTGKDVGGVFAIEVGDERGTRRR